MFVWFSSVGSRVNLPLPLREVHVQAPRTCPSETACFRERSGRNPSFFKLFFYGLVVESRMVVYSGFGEKSFL